MPRQTPEYEVLLTPAEVATMFRVDAKTVTRWAKLEKIPYVWTLGGHRRYPERPSARCSRRGLRSARFRRREGGLIGVVRGWRRQTVWLRRVSGALGVLGVIYIYSSRALAGRVTASSQVSGPWRALIGASYRSLGIDRFLFSWGLRHAE
ncbi:helix-turn-helix domain-containing protein [Actinomadura sp. NEAU-AAG5]|uniref:Helix-turn-helix domain-containing protein n=1 Tax=Actinomadura litoris TaxID=2678616 RepID=A0A7K1L7Y1_9ACTN|nr:helix-turn-helix domain-containing protein [Actinomadura litoris]